MYFINYKYYFCFVKMNRLILVTVVLFCLVIQQLEAYRNTRLDKIICNYYGDVDTMCNTKRMNVTLMPDECEGVVYETFIMNNNNEIVDLQTEFLTNLLDTNENVYVYMGYESYEKWSTALNSFDRDSGNVLNMFKLFFEQYPVKGVIFTHLDAWKVVPKAGFSAKFQAYIQMMKDNFPNIIFGINIDWVTYKRFDDIAYYDFHYLNMEADFFVLRLDQMNECTDNFLDGINPLDSSEQSEDVITIKNIVKAIEESSIDRDKLYLYLDYSPSVIEFYDDGSYETLCKGYEEVCKSQTETCDWCVDSLESLNEKGTYMRQHSQGLVLSFIDLDAHDDKWCDCKKSFPGFYAILDGWNGVPVENMQQCPLFDNTDIC